MCMYDVFNGCVWLVEDYESELDNMFGNRCISCQKFTAATTCKATSIGRTNCIWHDEECKKGKSNQKSPMTSKTTPPNPNS